MSPRFFAPDTARKMRRQQALPMALASALCGISLAAPAAQSQTAPTVTYEQVLAAPDDPNLNLAYARQQVDAGNLQQAGASLERLLLVYPNWDSVRLFYGVVLYRLDELEGAKRELKLLEGRGLSAVQEGERVKYLALAEQRSKRLRMSARLSLGVRYDSNPSRLNTDQFFFNVDTDPDAALTAFGNFRVEADLENGRSDFLFAEIGGIANNFFQVNQADYWHAPARAGIRLYGPGRIITLYGLASTTNVNGNHFRQQWGGGIDTTWSVASSVDWFLNGRARYEDYADIGPPSPGSLRDGGLYELDTGIKWRMDDKHTLTLSGYLARKDARNEGYAYDRGRLKISTLSMLGGGFYLTTRASYTRTEYDGPDFVSTFSDPRVDDRVDARVALGASLGALFAHADIELPEAVADIVGQVGVSYTDQGSNVTNFEYQNWSADLIFTKRIAF
ncbi:MAG: surface lipoprotein assembly modifier [Pseudomonadota bacterium]